jgi:uncharacterized protein
VRLVTAHARLSANQPWLVFAIALLVAFAGLAISSRLGFKGDFAELLPDDSREVRDLRAVEAKAGGGGYLVIQLLGGTAPQRRAAGAELAKALEAQPDLVRYVEWRFNAEFFRQRALWLLPLPRLQTLVEGIETRAAYEKAKANPLFIELDDADVPKDFAALEAEFRKDGPQLTEYLESKDGNELYLYVKPTQSAADLGFAMKLVAAAEATATRVLRQQPEWQGMSIGTAGHYVGRIEEDGLLKADASFAAALSLALTCALIAFGTRRASSLLVVAIPVSLGIVLTLAIATLTVGHLNPVTSFLAAILIGLGIEYGVHLSMRYWEERRELAPEAALVATMQGTLAGAATSAATNAAAFAVLGFADFAAFRQFGLIAAAGVVVTVLAAYALGPAILVASEKVRRVTPNPLSPKSSSRVQSAPFSIRATLAVIVPVALLTLYSLAVAKDVGFETDLAKLHGETPSWKLDGHITQQMGIFMVPAIVAVDSLEGAAVVTAEARALLQSSAEARTFDRVASLADVVPSDVPARGQLLSRLAKQLQALPEAVRNGERREALGQLQTMTSVGPWVVEDVPLEVRRRFAPVVGQGSFVLVFPRYSGTDIEQLNRWSEQLTQLSVAAEKKGVAAPILDGNRIAGKVFSLIRTDGPRIVLLAAGVVFLFILFSLRKLGAALLVVGPLYAGFACLVGVMSLGGLKLNIFNSVVLPSLLAIAVDNSVHLFHRYEEEGPGSLRHVLRETGYASVLATLSNAAGFVAMLSARHEGLRSVGTLAALGVACTFVGTTVVFPLLLSLKERGLKS